MRRIALVCFAVTAVALAEAAFAANDPFVGKWKLDVARSTIVDDMKVEAVGPNKYAFNFEGAPTETVVADGTDQPGLPGTTLSVKAEDPHSLMVVRKQDGRIIVTGHWRLSENGRTLRDSFMSLQPDGSKVTAEYLYRRMSGTSGFAGLWESTTKPDGLKLELGIEPYESTGLTFVSAGSNKNIIFDGREHPGSGDGQTYSGRRPAGRTIQYAEMNKGKVERARKFALSSDGRTLTETIRIAGQPTPDVFVFERE